MLFSLLFLLAATAPQQTTIPSLGETVEVSIVNVDVVVTDRKGNRIRGLTKDDFEIYDGKARQPISNFAEYSSAVERRPPSAAEAFDNRRPGAAAAPLNSQKRVVVIFFEQMRLKSFEAEPLVASIRETVHAIARPGDAVALVMWQRGATARIDYTDDLAKIDAGLATLLRTTSGVESDEVGAVRADLAEIEAFEAEARAMAADRGLRNGSLSRGANFDPTAMLAAMRARAEMNARVNAINATVSSMAAFEGKKVLILAPRRLGELAGGEFFFASGANLSITSDPYMQKKFGTAEMLRPVIENANANGVTIYPIFAPGLDVAMADATSNTAPDPAADYLSLMNETFSLRKIAERTGGLTAAGSTEAVKLLPQIQDDVSDYYSLAFRGGSGGTDRARDVVVKTRNPDYVVRARQQFVEKSDATRMKDRVAAQLMLDARGDFDITAELGPVQTSSLRRTVPMVVRIPVAALTTVPQGRSRAGGFSVFVAAGDRQGAFSDVTRKTQPFEIREKDVAKDGMFTYSLEVVLDKRANRIAVGVLDEVSKEFALTRIEVPKP